MLHPFPPTPGSSSLQPPVYFLSLRIHPLDLPPEATRDGSESLAPFPRPHVLTVPNALSAVARMWVQGVFPQKFLCCKPGPQGGQVRGGGAFKRQGQVEFAVSWGKALEGLPVLPRALGLLHKPQKGATLQGGT